MRTTLRPRRSVLYMPGSNPRALEKAKGLSVDALIFDLEDAVAPAAKPEARQTVHEALAAGDYGHRERIVRINGLDTEWGHEDLQVIAQAQVEAVLFPKVSDADTVRSAVAALEAANAPPNVAMWAMIETAAGINNAVAIAAAHQRLACFVLGTNDLANELRVPHTPDRLPLITSLELAVLAARAHGLVCIDGVHNAFRDEESLRVVCQQGRQLGFDGKTLIHPAQVETCNQEFSPTPEEVELAERYVQAHQEALDQGTGVAVVDNTIVEQLHVDNAQRVLAEAKAIQAQQASPASAG